MRMLLFFVIFLLAEFVDTQNCNDEDYKNFAKQMNFFARDLRSLIGPQAFAKEIGKAARAARKNLFRREKSRCLATDTVTQQASVTAQIEAIDSSLSIRDPATLEAVINLVSAQLAVLQNLPAGPQASAQDLIDALQQYTVLDMAANACDTTEDTIRFKPRTSKCVSDVTCSGIQTRCRADSGKSMCSCSPSSPIRVAAACANCIATCAAAERCIDQIDFQYTGQCGVSVQQPSTPELQRVVNGDPSIPFAWPWLAIIDEYVCGGVIYNERTIVTAAHCVDRRTSFIQVGTYASTMEQAGQQIINVKDIIVHPQYATKGGYDPDHDIAVLTLQKSITFGKTAVPVCMPSRPARSGDTCYQSGYGKLETRKYPDVPHQYYAPISASADCNKIGPFNSELAICSLSEPADSCFGDSGSPLVCYINNQWEYQGIVATGLDGGCGVGGIFTKVWSYVDFITTNAA